MSEKNPGDQEWIAWLDQRVFELMRSAEAQEKIVAMVRQAARREKRTTAATWNILKKKVCEECLEHIAMERGAETNELEELRNRIDILEDGQSKLFAALDIS